MDLFKIRHEVPRWQAAVFGLLCVLATLALWAFVTRGETSEERTVSALVLPSPQETFGKLDELWFERALVRNMWASLRRVCLGFALAVAVGVPIGVLCGCFTGLRAFFSPLTIFGRNIPVAALIPLTFSLFGIGEMQKVMFIFIACVAFVISDTARAVMDVSGAYIDTAWTLGASRKKVILNVLVPLALPGIFNSLRLLFGIAFGYIMLAEVVKLGTESGGLGDIIIMSQRRGEKEHILLVLLIIPIVAFALDRFLLWVQKQLFPYRYGGSGILNRYVRIGLHAWEDFKGLIWERTRPGEKKA